MASTRAADSEDAAAELMRLVAHGLKVHGLSVRLPDRDDQRNLAIDMTGGVCELIIGSDGYIEWDCRPKDGGSTNPRRLAGLASFLLTGRTGGGSRQDHENKVPGITFKGIVGQEARVLGLETELKVYADEATCDVTAEVALTNPASHQAGTVRVTDDGGILWEQDTWPEESDIHSTAVTAGAIVTRLAPAVSLARDAFRSDAVQDSTPSP